MANVRSVLKRAPIQLVMGIAVLALELSSYNRWLALTTGLVASIAPQSREHQ